MENFEQGMKDMELNHIEMALNNPLTSNDEAKRRCKRLLSMGETDTDTYKENCLADKGQNGAMMSQVRLIDRKVVSIFKHLSIMF